MSDPDMGSWSYQYDYQGNLTRQTDARGTGGQQPTPGASIVPGVPNLGGTGPAPPPPTTSGTQPIDPGSPQPTDPWSPQPTDPWSPQPTDPWSPEPEPTDPEPYGIWW
ncbi:MAG: RHS repeat protein [Chloroflexi bacterium]|nr:RHS repeat protein [Chloroflexota bacterium]